ncbi:hypothetical protein SLA2020_347010 [Shorea laevis]
MDSVVATVSGYHGSDRFNLIKLISHAGASYVGAMSPSITHLVCWKFEGKKYELAKKLGTTVVNHRWLEDCIKQGKRVPEGSYMVQSGEEAGPLVLEVPVDAEEDSLCKKRKVFSERSNVGGNCRKEGGNCRKEAFDVGDGGLDLAWVKSPLLDENLFSVHGTRNGSSHKLKSKPERRATKKENRSNSRNCYQETNVSGSDRKENEESTSSMLSLRGQRKFSRKENSNYQSSMQSRIEEKNTFNCTEGSSLLESSRKGRKLVKKHVYVDSLESELSDSLQDSYQTAAPKKYNKVMAPSILSLDERNVGISEIEGTFDCNFGMHRETTDDDQYIEEIKEWSLSPLLKNVGSSAMDAASSCKRISLEGCSDAENINGESQDADQTEEISCIICFEEFSETRGVLPCGHRFCYKCIQKWASSLTASRKVPTCPICTTSFVSITKMEDATISDQKMYSQTLPYSSSAIDVFVLPDPGRPSFGAQSLAPVCTKCRSREPEDLLISCRLCQIRKIHTYCLDPPLLPWTCIHCHDLPLL